MNRNVIRRMVQVVATFLLQGLLLFISSWTLKWSWAWLFMITQIIILVINYLVLPRELMAERGGKKKDVKKWDKALMTIALIPFFGAYILSGLDYRFKWSPILNTGAHILGLIVLFLGTMLFTWSMVSNKFFSTVVRIHYDRGHSLEAGGPYHYVRHPGYTGYIAGAIAPRWP